MTEAFVVNFMVGVAPVFAAFEVAQLFVAQRYIGIDQIRRKTHPLDAATVPPVWLSTGWIMLLLVDYAYQAGLFFVPVLGVRFAAVLLILVSSVGFALRRVCGLRWGLVVLTPECAARAGFFMFVFNMMVLHSASHHGPIPDWLYRR